MNKSTEDTLSQQHRRHRLPGCGTANGMITSFNVYGKALWMSTHQPAKREETLRAVIYMLVPHHFSHLVQPNMLRSAEAS